MATKTKRTDKTRSNGEQHIPCLCADCRRRAETIDLFKKGELARLAKQRADELERPPELVNYTDACQAIAMLRLYHHQVVERTAAELRPRFEAGEFYGCVDTPGGSPDNGAKGVKALLEECRDRIVSPEDACITLAFSPSTEAGVSEGSPGHTLMEDAAEAFAADILRVARLRRFYEMKPHEALTLWG